MGKVTMGPQRFTYCMPVTLVGTMIDAKPNFMVVASCGEVNAEPPMISVAVLTPWNQGKPDIFCELAFS